MTPLDRMRNQAGSKRPETFPFGVLGYGKPPNVARYRGMRLVPMVYLGPKSSTGCGLLGLPLEIVGPESERRIDVFSAFRPGRPLEWKKETLEPLCIPPRMNQEGGYPALPSTSIPGPPIDRKFLKRRRSEDGPERPEDVPESPMIAPEEPVPLEGPGEGEMDLDDESMYEPSESGGMQIDDGDLEDMLIESLHRQLYLEFMSDERLRFIEGMPSVTMDTAVSWFEVMFGGEQVVVLVPDGVVDEMTNEKLQHEQVHEGMKTEVESLEKLRVGQVVDEKTAKRLAAEAGVKILGSRWVISQKTPEIVRCRLVVKDFRTYGGPALLEGIYSPTSTVEALRFVLAYGAEYKCHFAGLDVSTAFMYAPLKEGERAVVRLPSSVVRKRGDRAFLSLSKAMNGLRQGPLRWYEELTNTLMENHAEPTFEATLFRMEFEGGYSGLVLVYVDDVLVCAQLKWHCDVVVELLQSRYQVKRTGDLFPEQIGQLKFLGRTIARLCQAGPICLGLETEYLEGVIRSFGERLKPNETLPDLERLYDKESKKYQGKDKSAATLTAEAYQRYRKVLGQLAWASITRSDLQYCVGFLSRYQQNPDQFAESCMRAILRWLLSRLTVVQTFPSENVEWEFANGPCEQIMGYCDASWNLSSVTGFLLFWRGSMLKSGSRKQAVPALSSPEAEVVALAESAKEGLSMACLVETALYGIKKTILGEPEQPISQIQVVLKTDSTSAQCIAQMKGLLRKVRHLQLRVVFLQHLVDSGQLVTRRIPGKENPADGLTKTMTHEMMQNLCSAAGLISLDKFPEKANLMNRKDTPSPKNLLGTSEVSDKEATPTPKDACPRQEGPQPQDLKVWSTAIAATTTKTRHAGHVKFDKVEIFEIDFASSLGFENLVLTGPYKAWNHEAMKFQGQVDLCLFEVCCSEESGLKGWAGRQKSKMVAYFGVTKERSLLGNRTQNWIKAVLGTCQHAKVPVVCHFSTPCTVGSPMRHLNFHLFPHYKKVWKRKMHVHREMWKAIHEVFGPWKQCCFVQEWPIQTMLWTERVYTNMSAGFNMQFWVQVDRCVFDSVFKEWCIVSNREAVTQSLHGLRCTGDHEHRQMSQTAKGFYPEGMCNRLGQAFLQTA
ncbi:unnamed protein product [Effrenium voratum]|nr:unnamed protein product [Effrenium voratum]